MTGWENVVNFFQQRLRVAACEVLIQGDADVLIDVCILEKKDTSLVVTRKEAGLSLENAKRVVGNAPVIASLTGESIIHKKIDKAKDEDWKVLLPRVIPKFRSHEFFIQYVPLDDTSGHLSIARRQVVESVMAQFAKEGFILFDVVLGPFALKNLAGGISDRDAIIKTRYYEIEISAKKINQIRLATGKIGGVVNVGEGAVESDILIQYASCIPFFTNGESGIEYFDTHPAAESRSAFEESSKLRKVMIYGASLFLVLLIGSAFAFAVATHKLSVARQAFGAQVRKSQPGENLAAEFLAIQATVEALGLTSHHYLSFYADRIAVTKPHEIFLTELRVFPIASTKQTDMTKFNTTIITVSGGCRSHEPLAAWIEKLNGEKWIATIQNQLYHQKDRHKPAAFSFDIQIVHR